MRRIKLEKELRMFDDHRKKLILLEKNYGETKIEISETTSKKEKLVSKNEKIHSDNDLVQNAKDFFLSNFRIMATILDYMLSYVILSYYSEFIPIIPTWLKALIAIIVLTMMELTVSLFEKDVKSAPKNQNDQNPFAYDEEYEEEVMAYEKDLKRNSRARYFRLLFIIVLPIVSLATMYQELGASFLNYSYEESNELTEMSRKADSLFIILKIVGLALCSFASHYFLTEYSDKIMEAKGRIRLEKEIKELDDTIDGLKNRLKSLEKKIIESLLDYYNKLKYHIARFGKHELLPKETFTASLDALYLSINGSKLT